MLSSFTTYQSCFGCMSALWSILAERHMASLKRASCKWPSSWPSLWPSLLRMSLDWWLTSWWWDFVHYRRTLFSYIWDLSALGVIIGYARDAIGANDMSEMTQSLCAFSMHHLFSTWGIISWQQKTKIRIKHPALVMRALIRKALSFLDLKIQVVVQLKASVTPAQLAIAHLVHVRPTILCS